MSTYDYWRNISYDTHTSLLCDADSRRQHYHAINTCWIYRSSRNNLQPVLAATHQQHPLQGPRPDRRTSQRLERVTRLWSLTSSLTLHLHCIPGRTWSRRYKDRRADKSAPSSGTLWASCLIYARALLWICTCY